MRSAFSRVEKIFLKKVWMSILRNVWVCRQNRHVMPDIALVVASREVDYERNRNSDIGALQG